MSKTKDKQSRSRTATPTHEETPTYRRTIEDIDRYIKAGNRNFPKDWYNEEGKIEISPTALDGKYFYRFNSFGYPGIDMSIFSLKEESYYIEINNCDFDNFEVPKGNNRFNYIEVRILNSIIRDKINIAEGSLATSIMMYGSVANVMNFGYGAKSSIIFIYTDAVSSLRTAVRGSMNFNNNKIEIHTQYYKYLPYPHYSYTPTIPTDYTISIGSIQNYGHTDVKFGSQAEKDFYKQFYRVGGITTRRSNKKYTGTFEHTDSGTITHTKEESVSESTSFTPPTPTKRLTDTRSASFTPPTPTKRSTDTRSFDDTSTATPSKLPTYTRSVDDTSTVTGTVTDTGSIFPSASASRSITPQNAAALPGGLTDAEKGMMGAGAFAFIGLLASGIFAWRKWGRKTEEEKEVGSEEMTSVPRGSVNPLQPSPADNNHDDERSDVIMPGAQPFGGVGFADSGRNSPAIVVDDIKDETPGPDVTSTDLTPHPKTLYGERGPAASGR